MISTGNIWKFKPLLFFLPVFIFMWFFFTYKITDVPPGINGDESPIGYNAILLSRTLHDENNRFLPLFVSTQNGVDWKQPVTMYATTLAFKLFGPSYEMLREVSVMILLISAVLFVLLFKEVMDLKGAFIGLFIFITTPIVMIQSHLALENIAPIPFVILWLIMLSKYEKSRNLKFIFMSGAMLGLSIYAYQAMRIIAPVFAVISTAFIFLLNKRSWSKSLKPVIYFSFGMLPFFLLLFWVRKEYPGALTAYNQPFKINSYQEFLLPFLSSFDLSFLFIKGDSTLYHSTGKHGVYLLATLPLFLLGSYQALKKKNPLLILSLAAFLFAPAFFGLVNSVHRGSRLLAMLPSYIIITTFGLRFLLESKEKFIKYILGGAVIVLILVNYFDFVNDYWFIYPSRAREVFPSVAHIAFKDLYLYSVNFNKAPVIRRDIYRRESVGSQFFEQLYFPGNLKKWEIGEPASDDSVILIHTGDLPTLEKQGYKKVGEEMLFYSLVAKTP